MLTFCKYLFEKPKFIKKPSSYYNPTWIKIYFVVFLAIIGEYWPEFNSIPRNFYSWTACVWAMGVYRPLNKGNTSLANEFFFSFYIRLTWGFIFAFVNTGSLIPNITAFTYNMVESFIASAIFIGMPLNTFNFLWGNRVFRLTVFILDQITGVGWVVT